MLALTSVIITIFLINQFVLLIEHAARGQYSVLSVIKLMVVMLPLMISYLLPLGLYLSIILVLGRWYVDQELVVMRACGMSTRELLIKILLFSTLVAIVVGILSFVLCPKIQRVHNRVLQDIAEQSVVSHILPQSFTNLGNNKTFYASKVSHKNKNLTNVFLAEMDAKNHWRVTSAESARESSTAPWHGRYLIFNSGGQLNIADKNEDYHAALFKTYGIRMDIPDSKISSWPDDATTSSLWSQYFSNAKVAAELQWRISLPLSVFLLVILAVPLSHLRPREGQFGKLFPAILIYLFYANFLWFGKSWVADGKVSPALGLWWVHGFLVVCIVFVYLKSFGWDRFKNLLCANRKAAA
jgi:lipopolysaccharide export system permease protein